jgi:CRISPR system Cascade subunit CasD
MQSWGIDSRFDIRHTLLEPSKSGVIGLCAAALGRGREKDVSDLASLIMGVRVDNPGTLLQDFQTAKDVYQASGGVDNVTSTRYYLSGANFLVGLAGEDITLLAAIHGALLEPKWPLFLGRKSYPPGEPVYLPDGLQEDEDLTKALQGFPFTLRRGEKPPREKALNLIVERPFRDGTESRNDQPVGAAFATRTFKARHVLTEAIIVTKFVATAR